MAGRPQLRIATHGKIKRIYQGGGVWLDRCRYRDTDGVTRIVQKLGPADEYDKYGKLAEDALISVLAERKRAGIHGEIGPDTKVADLVEQHLERLAEDGHSPVTMSTYRFTNTKLKKFIGGLRVHEATPARMDAALRSMRNAHGATMARQSKSILRGALQLAVMASVMNANPVRDVQPLRSKSQPKGAVALTAEQLRDLLVNLQTSEFCEKHDLVDPVTLLIATGHSSIGTARAALVGLRREDRRAHCRGKGDPRAWRGSVVHRRDEVGRRTPDDPVAPVRCQDAPEASVSPLRRRADRHLPVDGRTPRDPNNFLKLWRTAREELGVPDATTHSFRKTVATLIDDEGLSARIGADHLGQSNVSMTQDRHMTRGRIHTQVADLLDRTVRISDEKTMIREDRS